MYIGLLCSKSNIRLLSFPVFLFFVLMMQHLFMAIVKCHTFLLVFFSKQLALSVRKFEIRTFIRLYEA